MIDKLPLLHELAAEENLDVKEPEEEEIDVNNEKDRDRGLNRFMASVKEGHTIVKDIENQTEELNKQKDILANTTSGDKKKEISEEIKQILDDVLEKQQNMKKITDSLKAEISSDSQDEDEDDKTSAGEVKTRISGEEDEINTKKKKKKDDKKSKKKKDEQDDKKDECEKRIKENLFKALIKKYVNACQNFQNAESGVKKIMQEGIVRTAEIALDRKLSEQEKAEVINEPQFVQRYYEDKLKGTAHVKLQNAVADLEERHQDIVRLEKSLNELHQLVVELSQLVNMQGEMIENICDNIASAKDSTLKAEVLIKKAKENTQKARSKKCCVIVILAIVIAAVVIIVPSILKALDKI